jgi:hypothetical protein
MPVFPYAVWFRDNTLQQSGHGFEWIACILIDAENSEDAKSWGDHLAKKFSERDPDNDYLRSFVEYPGAWNDLDNTYTPTVAFGYEATDDEIGW